MRLTGLIILLLGLALMVVSFALFGTSLVRVFQARQVAQAPMQVGVETATGIITLSTDRLGQVSVYLDVHSGSVRVDNSFDDTDYQLQYRFPVRYEVLDVNGQVLLSEQTAVAWDQGMKTSWGSNVTSTGGTESGTHDLKKFKPPPDGQVQVKITLDPDQTYGAKVQSAELRVYDQVSKHAGRVVSAFFACCSGPVLFFAGLVILIIGLVKGRKT